MRAELKAWWRERRCLVEVPNGEMTMHDRCFRVSCPETVVIEETQDLRQSPVQIAMGSPRRATLVKARRRFALYRIDERPNGRAASGHWVRVSDMGTSSMELVAIAMVPITGFPVRRK